MKVKLELTKEELNDIKRAFDLLIDRENDQVYYSAFDKVIKARNKLFIDGVEK